MTSKSGPPVLSVVAPVFNEEETVEELVDRVVDSCRPMGVDFEFLVVNDGSRDETEPRLVALSRRVPELRVVNLLRNFGHMPALSAGIALARGQAVVVMDGDLQDPPELIPKLMERWRAGCQTVYGLRTRRRENFLIRGMTSLFYRILAKITEAQIPQQAGTFCLMDRRIVDVFNRLPERNRYFSGLRAWIGGESVSLAYDRPERKHGRSRVGIGGLLQLALTALISFSKVPLRYASFASLSFGLLFFLLGLSAIGVRLFTHLAIPGWATYTTLLGMMGFVQSVVLAIISEYLAVIFDEIKARPLYWVRDEFVRGERIEREPS